MAPLTTRQKEVLALIINENLSDKEIAARLRISSRTAKFHVSHLLAKFGVTRRGDLIVRAKSPARWTWLRLLRWIWQR